MSSDTARAIALQGRVLWALCLREIQSRHGKFKLGYIWEIIKSSFTVVAFIWIRSKAGMVAPDGMNGSVFIILGVIPWFLFATSLHLSMTAVSTNRQLLTFPYVTELDLSLGCSLVCLANELVVLCLMLGAIAYLGADFTLYSPLMLAGAFFGMWILGMSIGLILQAFSLYLPVIEKIEPMVMRILFFTSGLFFSPIQMSYMVDEKIMWIPMANYIELARNAFISPVIRPEIKLFYVASLTFVLFAAALLLERYTRGRVRL